VGTAKVVNIGAIVLSGADAANYTVGSALPTTADITALEISASAVADNKIYDATTDASVTITLVGLIEGDAVTATASGTFDDKNVETGKAVTVGTITLSGVDAANYSVAAAGTTMADITAAALIVSANPASKVEGDADPAFTFVATGFVGGETAGTALTGTLSRILGESPGGYAILQGELAAVDGNYDITFAGATFTIEPFDPGTPAPTIQDITFFNQDAELEDGLSLDSTGQRSMIRRIQIVFAGDVPIGVGAVPEGSFVLSRLEGGTNVGLNVESVTQVEGQTTVVLTFTNGTESNGSLIDGNYELTIGGTALGVDADGSGEVGGQQVVNFHRLFGDSDGDRDVDGADYMNMYRAHFGDTAYTNVFDVDDDDAVADDFMAFFMQYGKILNPLE